MHASTRRKFVEGRKQLDEYRLGVKQVDCPHCRQTGYLIGHGLLRGYAERGEGQEVRGRRFFCSNRFRRAGCGRTFSVLLSAVLKRFVVRARTLSGFAVKVAGGATRKAAWACTCGGAFSVSSAYRLWRRLTRVQPRLRTQLLRAAPPLPCDSHEPMTQLLEHLRSVVHGDCLFAGFQSHFQVELLV